MTLRLLALIGIILGILCFGWSASAQEEVAHGEMAGQTTLSADNLDDNLLGPHEAARGKVVVIAIGFGLAIAVAVGALSQGRVASSALEGLSRNPGSSEKVFLPFILGMVLIESLVIYALVISLLLIGKV